jgi:predicted DNA-binding transcriptional regulator YafY
MMSATLQRLERVLLMVPWLLERDGATVDELVAQFGGTPEDILADLDILGYCGLPGYGGGDLVEVTVFGDHVSVRMADFFARPLSLTVKEALTLLLAARALAGVDELPVSTALARAAAKLEALLGAEPAVEVDLDVPGSEHLTAVRQALEQSRVVRLVYRSESKAQTTERDVEPWALTAFGGSWYLQGWCRLAQAPRDFRLDRIRELAVLDERAAGSGDGPGPPEYEPAPGDATVVLDADPDAAWVGERVAGGSVERRGRRIRITFQTGALDWAARLVLGLGGHATVVEPEALRERVTALARATLARYEPPD